MQRGNSRLEHRLIVISFLGKPDAGDLRTRRASILDALEAACIQQDLILTGKLVIQSPLCYATVSSPRPIAGPFAHRCPWLESGLAMEADALTSVLCGVDCTN